jgi:hypothetical protein
MKLESDWWLELESSYVDRIDQRQKLFAEKGSKVLNYLPGSEHACKELLEHVIQFLVARYPHYFSLSSDKKSFENQILNLTTDLASKHPLLILLDHVPEDFCIMMREDKTGLYYFRAGIICSSVGWNLEQKFGLKLEDIHKPVPDFKTKMAFSMDRFFAKMPANGPIQRGSWSFEVGKPLYLEPGLDHATLEHVRIPDEVSAEEAARDIHFRVDWQTLKRLPVSGAIAFNFKALFTPLEHLRHEPYIPSLALKILTEGSQKMLVYKGTRRCDMAVRAMLRKYEQEQWERGLVRKDWEVQTLEESPFFPDWEQLWREEQDF